MPNKEEVKSLIWNNPIMIGKWIGFRDLTELHNKWLREFLFRKDDQTVQAHRGSYKTTTLSIFLAIHAIIKPNETVIYFRKTGSDVVEISRQVKNILNSGCVKEIVRVLYGVDLNLEKETGSEIHTNLSTSIRGTSQIVGLGIGTSITGKHADIIVTDDIVNINDRISRAERERTKIAYQELQNIKNRGGRFINTGTPWHPEDCFSIMPEAERYDCYTTGLISDNDILAIKESMVPSLFAANYELRHIASDDVIFLNPKRNADPSMIEQAKFCHIDASYGGEDGTAFTIVKKTQNKYYVFGKLWNKHVDDCIDEILQYVSGFMAGKIMCEDNGDKGYLAKELKKRGARAATYHENMNKFLKITTYLKSIWKDVEFVAGTDEKYIEQVTDYNENADHDDAPDSLASMARMLYGRRNEDEVVTSFMM